METKVVYQHNDSGWYVGQVVLDESDKSPLEEDVWLIPRNCVEKKPKKSKTPTKQPFWTGDEWILKSKYEKQETEPEEVDNLQQRKAAYQNADAMKNEIEFDAMVKGVEPDYTPWIELVKEIKERFPI